MKEIYLFAVAIAATVVVASNPGEKPILPARTQCPETNSGDAVHLEHESDCTKFYKCDWGQPVELDCPYSEQIDGQLHFNKNLQVCDWPWSAGCDPSLSPVTTTTKKPKTTTKKPTTKKPTTTTEKPTTTTKKPTTTTTTTKKPTTTTKKPTTTTTTTKKPTTTTKKPTTTTKKPTTTTKKPTTTTTEKPTTTTENPVNAEECRKGLAAGNKIPDKKNCKVYYICQADGSLEKKECDDNLVFDPTIGMCDWDDGTNCFSKLPDTPPKQNPKICPLLDDPFNPVILPHECQCDRYYSCENSKKVVNECPEDTGFDVDKKQCVPMSEAKCVNSEANEGSESAAIDNQPSINENRPIPSKDLPLFLRLFHWDN